MERHVDVPRDGGDQVTKYADWDEFMAAQRRSGLLQRISEFVTAERARLSVNADVGDKPSAVHPASADVFRFTSTPLRQVKVVILGQDPYHGPGQADGLAFSVRAGTKLPPSLKNIFEELWRDLVESTPDKPQIYYPNGDLTSWTRQGVLLLNTALTVRQSEPGSHLAQWQPFTDEVVRAVVDSADVAPHFILWGAKARATFERMLARRPNSLTRLGKALTDSTYTYSPHPSPLSADRGFFGSRPFSRANLALRLNNGEGCAVDWRLP